MKRFWPLILSLLALASCKSQKVGITPADEQFMREAIRLSIESVERGGGPFGAVIVKDGEIIAAQSNTVTLDNDPTAHAEVNAIRAACQALGTFDLDGCVIYTSCEPCPMCFGAIHWAGIDRIYYANTRKDAANIGFADDHIYRELARPKSVRDISETQLLRDEALAAFQAWSENPARTEY
jgi:tRNA(Arg) A34 adenosine deaminase TadA